VIGASLQGGDQVSGLGCGCRQRIPQSDRDIAQPAFMADAADCRAFQTFEEFVFAPLNNSSKVAASS
jgi:hypothetical protein